MSLEPGTCLGPYEVIARLGAGGMGEVFRARDTALDHDVALKVLPPRFAQDVDRLARFEREAKTLAAINHPHIAHIHGPASADGQHTGRHGTRRAIGRGHRRRASRAGNGAGRHHLDPRRAAGLSRRHDRMERAGFCGRIASSRSGGCDPAVSPDGRLIAYSSNTTGRTEVYVTAFPDAGPGQPVSSGGGRFPRWSRKGNELFFPCGPTVAGDPMSSRDFCAVPIESPSGRRMAPPTTLFDTEALGFRVATYGERGYDVSPDGTRILLQIEGLAGTPAITLIENAEAWLRRSDR